MQAVALPARAGLRWVYLGWTLFRSQPLAFFSWAMFISLILMIASITPPIGPILFVALIAMGAFYVAICIVMGLIAFMPFMSELSESVQTATTTNDLLPLLEAVRTPMIIFGVMYVLLAALFWYAPALVGWYGITLFQALFFSGVACWRNKWAFLVYGLCWAGVFITIDLAMSLLALIGLPDTLVATLQIPVNIAAGSVLYCSFYPNYISVFEASDTASMIN